MLCLISAALTLGFQPQHSGSRTPFEPTTLSPETIAKRTDRTLHDLTRAVVTYEYHFKLATGAGNMVGMAAVKDAKTFRVQAAVVGQTEQEGPTWETRVASGGQLATYPTSDPRHRTITRFTRRLELPHRLIDLWMRRDVGFVFSAIGSDATPLENLVKEARTTPGYQVYAKQRTIHIQVPPSAGSTEPRDVPVVQYEIAVQRTPQAAKKYGKRFYQIVIDSLYYIPITMNTITDSPAGKNGALKYFTEMNYTRWNRHPKTFPAGCFQLKTALIQSRALQ